eukprot:5430232-Pyramimonas_sp.AAC.1
MGVADPPPPPAVTAASVGATAATSDAALGRGRKVFEDLARQFKAPPPAIRSGAGNAPRPPTPPPANPPATANAEAPRGEPAPTRPVAGSTGGVALARAGGEWVNRRASVEDNPDGKRETRAVAPLSVGQVENGAVENAPGPSSEGVGGA